MIQMMSTVVERAYTYNQVLDDHAPVVTYTKHYTPG